ncbi:MAG TPA: asparagine synthase (glutamine-hydrolyzing) [bacterium]|nr:asparagine synthase (glutamine-hydrolyzing) [bacterium]
MCGISGILRWNGSRPEDPRRLADMVHRLGHRGPDGRGLYLDDWISLGHTRLSLIDLKGGFQPISNEEGTLWLVCNGEIFNYIELRQLLRRQGHQFCSDSDVEVVVHLYEIFGDEFVNYLNGQFALALWDQRRQRLVLARDHIGICPLYYYQDADRFIFASEIKALLQLPDLPREWNFPALLQTFTFWSPLPGDTPFRGIQEVKPGCLQVLTRDSCSEKKWWSCTFAPEPTEMLAQPDEADEALRELLTDAVRIRLRADVPVGAYLSGGLDSSITTALMHKVHAGRLKTFSIGFENESFDETPYQDAMIHHLNTEHSRIRCSDEEIARALPQAVLQAEKPLLRSAPAPMWLLSSLVRREDFKVVLTGEGADEYFSGYNIYKETKIRAFIARQPGSAMRKKLLQKLYPYLEQGKARQTTFWQDYFLKDVSATDDLYYSHRLRWQNGPFIRQFLHPELQRAWEGYDPQADLDSRMHAQLLGLGPLARAHVLETGLFLPGYLISSQGDRMLMAHGIEGRYPFLDKRVIHLATLLAPALKLKALNEKWILKKTFGAMLPRAIVARAKQPYRAPIRGLVQACEQNGWHHLDVDRVRQGGLFNTERAEWLKRKVLDRQASVSARDEMAVLAVITLHMLQDAFISNHQRNVESDERLYPTIDRRTAAPRARDADSGSPIASRLMTG